MWGLHQCVLQDTYLQDSPPGAGVTPLLAA